MASPNKDSKDEKEASPPRVYTYQDLVKFQTTEPYSSIGRMRLSTKTSSAAYGFGSADRKTQEKVYFSKDALKTELIGRTSHGPNYEVRHTDKFTYRKEPEWHFSIGRRNTLGEAPRYAYFHRMDADYDPAVANDARKERSSTVKIGLEQRFITDTRASRQVPGPEYSPGPRPEIPNKPKYTMGFRREIPGISPLVPLTCTPNIVGPGRYIQNDALNTSNHTNDPKWSMPKTEKFLKYVDNPQKNQTYDTRSSIGTQIASSQRNFPAISIGRAKRDAPIASFSNSMSKTPAKIRIEHPQL